MHRVSLQRTLLKTNCLNKPFHICLRTSLRTIVKPSLAVPLLSALGFTHVDKKKAIRIGSRELPATPSEIEFAQSHLKSRYKLIRICQSIVKFLDDWLLEPIMTVRRLAHILILFIPVAATVPIVFFGQKVDKDDTTGTLWWYDFLATQMERAGPTFIKVSIGFVMLSSYSLLVACSMGCI